MVKVWESFRFHRGEIEYFAGMKLARIHHSFESLERNLEMLKTLQGRCSNYSEAVSKPGDDNPTTYLGNDNMVTPRLMNMHSFILDFLCGKSILSSGRV
jgi:hypothetical protein